MALSIPILIIIISLHLHAFFVALSAERHRSTAKVVQVEALEYFYSHCVYAPSDSTESGLLAFGLLLISQTLVNSITKCLHFGTGVVKGCSRNLATVFFIISWVSFLGAEAFLLFGSIKNARHTKYRSIFFETMSCEILHEGVFAAGAAFVFLSMVGSVVYYWVHSMQDTGDWEKLHDEGLPMISSDLN